MRTGRGFKSPLARHSTVLLSSRTLRGTVAQVMYQMGGVQTVVHDRRVAATVNLVDHDAAAKYVYISALQSGTTTLDCA